MLARRGLACEACAIEHENVAETDVTRSASVRRKPGMLWFLAALAPAPLMAGPAVAQTEATAPSPAALDPVVAHAWKLDQTDLPPDPGVRYGVLANGMRYAIRRNRTPEATAAVRLAFEVGSIAEAEDQRGLAHFIEHMAFNGTTHVPEGEMVKILERLGLSFGADTNAYTTYDQTGYTLDLPNVREETVDTALFLLRETASEISFDPGAIDRERGVILSELRDRNDYAQRNSDSLFSFTVPGTRIADRPPIGDRAIIEHAPAERFRAFYDRYYTPARATLVIVGDIDVDAVEAKIRARFADWQARQGEAPDVPPGTIDLDWAGLANLFVHPAIEEAATLIRFSPYVERPDTLAKRREDVLRAIAYNIIGRRLARMARAEDAPYVGASIGRSHVYKMANQSVLTVMTRDGEWARGIAAAEREVRGALAFGFTQAEIDEQIANFTTGYANAVRGADTRRSDVLASQLVAAASDGMVVTTPQSQQARFTALKDAITPESALAALRADFVDLDRPLIHLSTKAPVAGGIDAVLTSYAEARAEPPLPPRQRDAQAFAYTDFGPEGTLAADGTIEDLGIRTIRFANNVRLNLKPTDFEEGRVQVSLRIDGGDLLATRDNPEATSLMNIFVRGGLEAHSLDDLYSIFAGRSVSLSFGSGDDFLGGYVSTTPDDLLLQMQILAAFVTHPGYRSEALAQYRSFLPNFYARLSATPESAIGSRIGAILSDNDPRFSLADQSVFAGLTFDQLRGAIADRLQHGAIEIGIVGDFDEAAAIDAVARTFGALPVREAEFNSYTDARQRSFTADRSVRTLIHDGEPDQAVVEFYWPTTDNSDFDTDVRLRMLAELLQLKVTDEIRERLGASYSPVASSFTSSIYPGYGYIRISVSVDSGDVERVAAAVRRIAADLSAPLDPKPEIAERAISADELLRAREPILENLANSLHENSAWLGIVDEAQSDPQTLARFRISRTAFDDIKTPELLALARRYLAPDKAVEVASVHGKRDPIATVEGESETRAGLAAR